MSQLLKIVGRHPAKHVIGGGGGGGGGTVTSIALLAQTFDGSTATVTTSNGIPLTPGLLMPGQTSLVRWFIDGIELPIYVEELSGRHSDGSLQSIYIQSVCALSPTSVAGECRIGQTRTIGTLTDSGATRSVPVAGAIPSSPAYIIGTDIVLPVLTKAAQLALGGVIASYDSYFFDRNITIVNPYVGYAEWQWTQYTDDWPEDYYDRALVWWRAYAKTGNPVYWYRCVRAGRAYRDNYLYPNVLSSGGVQPYQQQLEGVALHYWASGDATSKAAVLGQTTICHIFWRHYNDIDLHSAYTDDRSHARVIEAMLLAWRLSPTGSTPNDSAHDPYAPETFASIVAATPAAALANLDPTTGRGITLGGTLQINYMQGMVCSSLAMVRHYFPLTAPQLADVQTVATKTCAFLDTQWIAGVQGFQYATELFDLGNGAGGDTSPEPTLNPLMQLAYGLAFEMTGTASYKTRGDALVAGTVAAFDDEGALQYPKEFNQTYRDAWHYFVQRA